MKKVSIITPCFNGEKYINRYLDSLLNQTHVNLEIIFINDGSSDKTEEIVKSYSEKFESKGMDFKYIYQENAGQAAALNKGLKIFTGEYLTWPDCDDFLPPDSVEKKVKFFEENPSFDIVRSDVALVGEDNMEKIIGYYAKNNPNKFKEDLFDDYILENKVWFSPGCFMIKSAAFLKVNKEREIYSGPGGQNWQMILPILYKNKCGYIDEVTYIYTIRSSSHSRNFRSYHEELLRCKEHLDILIETLKKIEMNDNERTQYNKLIEEKYIRKKLYLSSNYRENVDTKFYYNELLNLGKQNLMDKVYYYMSYNKFSYIIGKLFIKAHKILCKIKDLIRV